MRVVLVGAGNPHVARVAAAVQRADPDYEVAGFLDNDPAKWGTTFAGFPVLGGFAHLDALDLAELRFVNLIARDQPTRYRTTTYLERRGCRFTSLLHPEVDLGLVELGTGLYVEEGAHVQGGATLGDHATVLVGATVAHEATLGRFAFVAGQGLVGGRARVDEGAFVGVNATVLPRVHVGAWATVGAGAVVARDVPTGVTVAAAPGRVTPDPPVPPPDPPPADWDPTPRPEAPPFS